MKKKLSSLFSSSSLSLSLFSLILVISIFQFSSGNVFGATSSAQFNWSSDSYSDVVKLEFYLNLNGSLLDYIIKKNKKIIFYKNEVTGVDGDDKYEELYLKKVNKYAEKLILRLTGEDGKYFDFTNFLTKSTPKRFDDIVLVRHKGLIKAKVIIYLHKTIDKGVYDILYKDDKLSLKSASYLFIGIKNGKSYKKVKSIRVK